LEESEQDIEALQQQIQLQKHQNDVLEQQLNSLNLQHMPQDNLIIDHSSRGQSRVITYEPIEEKENAPPIHLTIRTNNTARSIEQQCSDALAPSAELLATKLKLMEAAMTDAYSKKTLRGATTYLNKCVLDYSTKLEKAFKSKIVLSFAQARVDKLTQADGVRTNVSMSD
jgi:hypothetical protein